MYNFPRCQFSAISLETRVNSARKDGILCIGKPHFQVSYYFVMHCSRCRRWIEGRDIKFSVEGDYVGKPICKKCKAETEEESRERYRNGLAEQHSGKNHYGLSIYRLQSNDKTD